MRFLARTLWLSAFSVMLVLTGCGGGTPTSQEILDKVHDRYLGDIGEDLEDLVYPEKAKMKVDLGFTMNPSSLFPGKIVIDLASGYLLDASKELTEFEQDFDLEVEAEVPGILVGDPSGESQTFDGSLGATIRMVEDGMFLKVDELRAASSMLPEEISLGEPIAGQWYGALIEDIADFVLQNDPNFEEREGKTVEEMILQVRGMLFPNQKRMVDWMKGSVASLATEVKLWQPGEGEVTVVDGVYHVPVKTTEAMMRENVTLLYRAFVGVYTEVYGLPEDMVRDEIFAGMSEEEAINAFFGPPMGEDSPNIVGTLKVDQEYGFISFEGSAVSPDGSEDGYIEIVSKEDHFHLMVADSKGGQEMSKFEKNKDTFNFTFMGEQVFYGKINDELFEITMVNEFTGEKLFEASMVYEDTEEGVVKGKGNMSFYMPNDPFAPFQSLAVEIKNYESDFSKGMDDGHFALEANLQVDGEDLADFEYKVDFKEDSSIALSKEADYGSLEQMMMDYQMWAMTVFQMVMQAQMEAAQNEPPLELEEPGIDDADLEAFEEDRVIEGNEFVE